TRPRTSEAPRVTAAAPKSTRWAESAHGIVMRVPKGAVVAKAAVEARRAHLQEGPRWAVGRGGDQFGVFATFKVRDVAQKMRWIPPGKFRRGSPYGEKGRYSNEGPQHNVSLSRGFWLADTPCTQTLWQAVMHTSPSWFKGPDLPVEHVSW